MFLRGHTRIFLLLLALPVLGGCLNNGGTKPYSNTSAKQGLMASNPLVGGQDDGTNLLKLLYVVRNSMDPSGTLDLIGDDSQTMGQFCAANTTAAQVSAGASNCTCVFDYIKADGAHESFEVPTIYNEASLLRCKYTQVPAGLPYMNVRIHLTNADAFSNTMKFYFQSGTNSIADLSNPVSFIQAQRYQCKDLVTIGHIFDPTNMYDPFQSADPALSFPLNFYTNNLGGALAAYVGANVQSWNCPPIPNDPNENMDRRIFSVYADNKGSKLIYPPEGSEFDRSTFYLAKKSAGAFEVAINAYIAPQLASADPGPDGTQGGTAPPPLGYGAKTVVAGSGREVCPVDTVIPPGFKWVKLWLFRADLPKRKYRTSGVLSGMHSVACQPDPYFFKGPSKDGTTITNTAVINSCKDVAESYLLRIFGGPEGNASCQPITVANNSLVEGQTFHNAENALGFPKDTLYNDASRSSIVDAQPGTGDLDGTNPRYDFLFVVSPPEVMSSEMIKSESAARYTYTPYRFPIASDCTSNDPDQAGKGDCLGSKIIHYEIKLHDVAGNGDPPGDDPSRQGVFPVCALQPL
ncbi:hypothetical protein WDW37_19495 [Bdellovibrionota bacterium FG-1]